MEWHYVRQLLVGFHVARVVRDVLHVLIPCEAKLHCICILLVGFSVTRVVCYVLHVSISCEAKLHDLRQLLVGFKVARIVSYVLHVSICDEKFVTVRTSSCSLVAQAPVGLWVMFYMYHDMWWKYCYSAYLELRPSCAGSGRVVGVAKHNDVTVLGRSNIGEEAVVCVVCECTCLCSCVNAWATAEYRGRSHCLCCVWMYMFVFMCECMSNCRISGKKPLSVLCVNVHVCVHVWMHEQLQNIGEEAFICACMYMFVIMCERTCRVYVHVCMHVTTADIRLKKPLSVCECTRVFMFMCACMNNSRNFDWRGHSLCVRMWACLFVCEHACITLGKHRLCIVSCTCMWRRNTLVKEPFVSRYNSHGSQFAYFHPHVQACELLKQSIARVWVCVCVWRHGLRVKVWYFWWRLVPGPQGM